MSLKKVSVLLFIIGIMFSFNLIYAENVQLSNLPVIIYDTAGDGGITDITTVQACHDNSNVYVRVNFANGFVNNFSNFYHGEVYFDTDQNPSTGFQPYYYYVQNPIGTDYVLYWSSMDSINVYGQITQTDNYSYSIPIQGKLVDNSIEFIIPLSCFNYDDGNMNIGVMTEAYFYDYYYQYFRDYAPNDNYGTINYFDLNSSGKNIYYDSTVDGGQIDIVSSEIAFNDSNLKVLINFDTLNFNSIIEGGICFDTDQNPQTGCLPSEIYNGNYNQNIGLEYLFRWANSGDYFRGDVYKLVYQYNYYGPGGYWNYEYTGTVIGNRFNNSIEFLIPLNYLGNDDGNVDITMFSRSYDFNYMFLGEDYLPDSGYIRFGQSNPQLSIIKLNDYTLRDIYGNNNGIPEQNETIELIVKLESSPYVDTTTVIVDGVLTTNSPNVYISNNFSPFNNTQEQSIIDNSFHPFNFVVNNIMPFDSSGQIAIPVNLTLTLNNNKQINFTVYLGAKKISKTTSNSSPKIYGNKIVYQDKRAKKTDVYIYDLITNEETKIHDNENFYNPNYNPYDSTTSYINPAIYKNKIVYLKKRLDMYGKNFDFFDVCIYDIYSRSETLISTGMCPPHMNIDDIKPAIYGNKVVYQSFDAGWRIRLYDLDLQAEVPLNLDYEEKINPSIYENKIVYQKGYPGYYRIYVYDLITGIETSLGTNYYCSQINPSIYKNRIAYQDNRNGNWDIFIYDLDYNTETPIYVNYYDNFGDQINPVLFNNRMVYQDNKNGNWDVYLYDTISYQILADSTNQVNPYIWGKNIAWCNTNADTTNNFSAIYAMKSSNFNERPIAIAGQDQTIFLYESVKFDGSKSYDPDGEIEFYNWNFGDDSNSSNEAIISHTYNSTGIYNAVLAVIDNNGFINFDTCVINVKRKNNPPVLETIGYKSINENEFLTFRVNATDPDGDALIISTDNLPAGASYDSSMFNWTPDYKQAGYFTVTFNVSDGEFSVSETVTINVMNVNRKPILLSLGNKSVDENQFFDFIINASDPDGDALNLSTSNLPNGARTIFDSTFKAFSWIPDYNQSGNYNVTFTVSDAVSSVSETITITVNNVNRTPVFEPAIGNSYIYENQNLNFLINNGTDPDGDAITYSVSGLPTGATFSQTRIFNWTPNYTQAGNYNITFTISDGSLNTTETITIYVYNTNRAPVFTAGSIVNKTVNENQLLKFTISASDPDGETLIYSVAGLPIGAKFDSTKTFSWTPNYSQSGVYNVTFNVSDGILSDSKSMTITVNNINQAPVVGTIIPASGTLPPNNSVNFTATYTDADGFNNIKEAYLLVNTAVAYTNCVYAIYDKNTNKIYLRDDANLAWIGGYAPGENIVIENSYCKIDLSQMTVSGSVNTLTINWNATFKSTFLGIKSTYLKVVDASNKANGFIKKGTWTINTAPTVDSISPATGVGPSNTPATFSAIYSDPDGWDNIKEAYIIINTTVNGTKCFYVKYDKVTNKIYIRNDANTAWVGGYTPGENYTIENSYCKLDCSQTSVIGSGNSLSLTVNVTFKTTFLGLKNCYLNVIDIANKSTGFYAKGKWTINTNPVTGTISPEIGTSIIKTPINFTATYIDPDGWQNTKEVYLLINTSTGGTNCFYAMYSQNTNKLYMRNNTNTAWVGGYAPGTSYIIKNSYASLDCSKTTFSGINDTLIANWNATFESTFVGTKNSYTKVIDDMTISDGWSQKGTWSITK